MTYTKSIRKIFIIGGNGTPEAPKEGMTDQFSIVSQLAEAAKYEALAFNGTIYILCKDDGEWRKTVFNIEDFQID